MPTKSAPTFQQVKAILDWLVKGKEGRLQIIHGPRFGWKTRDELLQAVAKPEDTEYRLIDPALVGNGRGAETNLVRILTAGFDGYPRMPYEGNGEGKYATPEELATLIAWIDAGAPE